MELTSREYLSIGIYFRGHTGGARDLNRQVVVGREKRRQMILRFGVYMSGKDIVIHRSRKVRQYSRILKIRLRGSWVFWEKMSGA